MRFLVIGTGPLIDEPGTTVVSGQCLRTMHFVNPMREAGHEVNLATVPIPGGAKKATEKYQTLKHAESLLYKAFTTADETAIVRMLRNLLDRQDFDGVVGINAYPAYLLAKAEPSVPFWADLNGWTMAEGQTRAARHGHDRDYDHFWKLEVTTLLEADVFSTVSERQGDALFGELGLVGRLNSLTFAWPFSRTIPNAIYPLYNSIERRNSLPESGLFSSIPTDAHIILWSGGFNTWTDTGLLVEGVGRALEQDFSLHFVATGAGVKGHDEKTYVEFVKRAQERWPNGRSSLLGWVETPEVLALHARANVGINIDSLNTETRFGARNRLTNMLGAGVPIVTTRGTEIAQWIEEHGAGTVIDLDDAGALANALLESSSDRPGWEARAQRAREAARADFAPAATLREFLDWCAKPRFAPDRDTTAKPVLRERIRTLQQDLEPRTWARLKAEGQVPSLLHDREALKQLRRKLPLRLWYQIKSLGKRL